MDSTAKLIRNKRLTGNNGIPRVWLEYLLCEQANLGVGESISYTQTVNALVIQKSLNSKHKVSKRKRPSWSKHRPLIDYTNEDLALLFQVKEKVDILVSDSVIVIRKSCSFDLCVIGQPRLETSNPLQKLTLASFPSGAGVACSALEETGYFESKVGGDIWDLAVETYTHNFQNGNTYWSDIRSMNPSYIPSVSVTWLSPPCVEFSMLGAMNNGLMEGLGPHFARLVMATNCRALIIEQVPQYFKSRSFEHLKGLLAPMFPYWSVKMIDAYDMGAVSSRKRGYAVAFQEIEDFQFPSIPNLPEHRRLTVGQVIGSNWEEGDWRKVQGSTMEHLLNKSGNNNFTAEKNRTLVGLEDKKISCIIANYSKINVTSSYLRHPDNPNLWRLFRSDELAKFLDVPEWFSFPEYVSENQRSRLLGQSVACNVVKAIGIEVAYSLMKRKIRSAVEKQFSPIPMETNTNNQLAFII